MKKIFENILSLLRVRQTAGGLEVSDQAVRLAYFDGKIWQMHAIRLEPGTMERGKMKDRAAFVAALTALRAKIGGGKKAKKMNVVVCLSSIEAYTQVFSLPMVQGEDLEKAVALNLQMASPLAVDEAYSGWQIVGRDEGTVKLEILSVFIERKMVDEVTDALFEAGFIVTAVESRALALTRVLREKGAGVGVAKSYLFVDIDDSGLDFLIVRNGALYFEYATPWRDLMDEKGEILVAKFETALAASIRQVMNFYSQHWSDPVGAIIFSAMALEAEAEKAITENAPLPPSRLTLVMGQPVSSEWLTALGCSLRGARLETKDQEVNLLGEDSRDRFHEEQLLSFMRFWRVLVPITLGILALTFAAAAIFLMDTRQGIEARSDFSLGNQQASGIASLEALATAFNRSVALLAATEGAMSSKEIILKEVMDLAAANHVTVDHLSFQSFGAPISLSGSAAAEDAVVAFKTALQNNPHVSAVNLPLTGIQTNGSTVIFSMTFVFTQ